MQLSQSIEASGVFWLPDKPEDKMHGKVSISEKGEVSADMFCYPGPTEEYLLELEERQGREEVGRRPLPLRILGVTYEGIAVTLDDCLFLEASRPVRILQASLPPKWQDKLNHTPDKYRLHVSRAFWGAHVNTEEEIFSSMTFSIEGLENWLWFYRSENSGDAISSLITLVDGQLPDDFTMHLYLAGYGRRHGFGVEEKGLCPRFGIASSRKRSFIDFSRVLRRVRAFLCLAFNCTPSFKSIIGSLELDDHDSVGVYGIDLDGKLPKLSEDEPFLGGGLITFKEARHNFTELLTKWLKSYEEPQYNVAFYWYFQTAPALEMPLDAAFSVLMQCVEGLHRATYSGMKDEDAERHKNDLDLHLKDADKELRAWVKEKLAHATELTLSQRMKTMMPENFERLFDDQGEKFVKEAVSIRNAFAHPEGRRLEAATNDTENLVRLYRDLETFVTIFLLETLLGIKCDQHKIDIIKRGRG